LGKRKHYESIDKDYVDGYEDRTFRPELNVSRAEFLKMAVIALKLPLNKYCRRSGMVQALFGGCWSKGDSEGVGFFFGRNQSTHNPIRNGTDIS
jgi:hypothetical protein